MPLFNIFRFCFMPRKETLNKESCMLLTALTQYIH
jgi:hypothetical protein